MFACDPSVSQLRWSVSAEARRAGFNVEAIIGSYADGSTMMFPGNDLAGFGETPLVWQNVQSFDVCFRTPSVPDVDINNLPYDTANPYVLVDFAGVPVSQYEAQSWCIENLSTRLATLAPPQRAAQGEPITYYPPGYTSAELNDLMVQQCMLTGNPDVSCWINLGYNGMPRILAGRKHLPFQEAPTLFVVKLVIPLTVLMDSLVQIVVRMWGRSRLCSRSHVYFHRLGKFWQHTDFR